MAVCFHKSSMEFHLYNQNISYILNVLENGQIGHIYFGKKLRDRESFAHMLNFRARPMSVCPFEGKLEFSMEHIKQEYPVYGSGDMRYPALEILQENGSRISEFLYKGHSIYQGKPELSGLPATYVEKEEEADTLELYLEDQVSGTEITLYYTIFANVPAVARSAKITQKGDQEIVLDRAMSMSVDLPDMDFEMIELTGAWARERSVKERKLEHGVQAVYSLRGCSSHNYNPFLALKREETTEGNGEVYGFSLVYSGNFLAQADVDTYDTTRVTMGIHPDTFSWNLKPGETFQTPEAVMVYSDHGLNGMSQAYHTLYRSRLARGFWRDRERPVLINNWEATYFDFDEDKILEIVKTAKELGVELFVLDDGWFGKRNDDTSSLGDWYPNLEKLPDGITGVARRVEEMGLKFGLWFEPEMTNKESRLYREHPDWILSVPGRKVSVGRNQYVLDFSREEVVNAIFEQMKKVLAEAPISYIKWDMNRSMSEVYSAGAGAKDQGKVMHKYILGVYRLYDMLTKEFPEILFESCASGGARFDPGLLYYAPQCWTSDDTDAVERCKIQYGTSFVYPVSSMGAHVSAVPNHQLLRNTSLETRANVAYFGTFGYELDPNRLTEEEKEEVKAQITFMKQYRHLIQYGTFYRLLSPFEGNETAWMVVSEDKTRAIVGYYKVLQSVNGPYKKVRLQGLDPDRKYHVAGMEPGKYEEDLYGDELLWYGLNVSDASSGENKEKYNGKNGDYQSRLYLLSSIE